MENAKEIKIHEKINGEYELSFQISVTDEKFQYVQEENIIKEPDGQLFVIREIDTARNGSKLMATVVCEHVFFLAIDEYHLEVVLQSATAEQAMTAAFAGTPYTVVTVEPITLADIELLDTNPIVVTNEIIKQCGGELHRNNFSVSLLNRLGADNGVQFRYRKNLKNIKRNVNTKSLVTRLIPLGKDDLSISSINGGVEYIDSQYIGNYRRPKYSVMRWPEIDDENELLAKAQEYLAKADVPEVSYEVDVVELKALAEYGNLESFSIGDDITIIDEELSVNVKARIVDYERYPKEPRKSRVVIANFRQGLEDLQAELKAAKDKVDGFTTMAGRVRAPWLEGIINILQNQLLASGSYTSAQVIEGKGLLLENTNVDSQDYGALYLGPGIFAISSAKDYAGKWIWRTFGTGKGFTADEMNTGLLRSAVVQIGPDSTYAQNYNPATKANTFRQATQPTAIAVGDIWFNTADKNKQYRWSGTAWDPVRDTDIDALNNFVNTTYPADFAYLEGLIDGNITTWFYAYTPTLENIPASDWTTSTEKDNHLGDLFYDSTTGYAYRFVYDDSVYSWQLIPDTDVAIALALAQQAQDTADGKRRVFLVQPAPPYDIGDLWSGGPTGDIERCVIAKLAGQSYSSADWELAAKYTDDTRANEAMAAVNAASVAAANAITAAAGAQATADGKVTTFFQPEPPNPEDEGDLWIDTNDGNKIYRSNGTYWVPAQDSGISQAIVAAADAQSIADRKIVTFYQDTEPAVASYGDLWFDTNDGNKPYRYYGMERSIDTTGAYDPNDAINWVAVQDSKAANSVQQAENYNGVVIDSANGVVVTRGDNKVRVILNATGGIKIQQLINGVWVDMLYADTDGSLTLASKIKIGTGENVCKADENGLYLGSDTFSSAPFRVSPTGQVIATDGSFKGDVDCESLKINTVDVLEQLYLLAKSISAGTLKTGIGGITKVEGDIVLGPGSTISWDSITDKENVVEKSGTDYTYLQKDKIYSPIIEGGSIISNTTIDVGTDVHIGRKLYMNPGSFTSDIMFTSGDAKIYGDPAADAVHLSAPGGVYAGTQRLDQPIVAKFG